MFTATSSVAMNQTFLGYYRCPEFYADFRHSGQAGETRRGFFRLGPDLVCYGHCSTGTVARAATDALHDVLPQVSIVDSACYLPYNLDELVTNFRREYYVPNGDQTANWKKLARSCYYRIRPLLGVSVRKHLQRVWLNRWDRKSFPGWPVDRTVDRIFEKAMLFSLKAHNVSRIPFIWFWPEGKSSCAVMTHDVESLAGLKFCDRLMDMDDSFGIKASFQLVPEERYPISDAILEDFRRRGFEVNVHDLNHDGHLFDQEDQFRERARLINEYGRRFGSVGFRSGALYHNVEWYDALSFCYDMSVPNVAHLDPQPGGCCTIMPFFVDEVLELPVTTIQDYSLFHVLTSYSIELWQQQIQLIMQHHGLANFIVHPDYLDTAEARNTYAGLLGHLALMREQQGLWIALPRDVNSWWRQRDQMRLVRQGTGWSIEGPNAEHARVAYASLSEDKLMYSLAGCSAERSATL